MRLVRFAVALASFMVLGLVATSTSFAQSGNYGYSRANYTSGGVNPVARADSIRRNAIFRRPTVSPYLQLIDNSGASTTPYHSRVRPQLQQQQFNRQQRSDMQRIRRQVGANANAIARSREGTQLRATGHQTFFGNLSHFYPNMSRRR